MKIILLDHICISVLQVWFVTSRSRSRGAPYSYNVHMRNSRSSFNSNNMPGNKRKVDTVDLTGDSDENNQSHRAKKNKSHTQPSSSSQGRSYPTPPASSSQPASSQPGNRVHGYPASSQSNHSSSYGRSHSQRDRDSWLASTQEQEDDIRQEIDLEEDFDDDVYANYQLYGIMNTKIVGCRFYGGRCVVGEYVKVRREPSNPYDTNAIRIDNVMAEQIGHIGRAVAAKPCSLNELSSTTC